ncbi:pyruvate dehydrogenase (acetyl-transferring) E1 component subunit alpha [Streptomyces sp. NPDC001732]
MTVESTAARKPRRSSRTSAVKTTAKTSADTPAKTTARTPAKKSAKAPAKTTAKKTAAKTPARASAKAPQRSEPELVQLLTPEGERVEHPDYSIDLTDDELRGLYRDMVLTRRFDAEATALQRQGELGLWASLLGQEAAQIGSGRALRDDDYVFPTYREHGVAWCRGVDPTNLLGMFRGVNHGGWDPNSNNFHLYTIVIGSQTLHATGYAMGVAKDGADSAVIAYFGDGASSQGDVAESFTFSAVYNAPVVFFCQNNQWAISEPTEKQTRVPLYQRAQGFGFPGVRVDGNDVLACLAVTRSALERARRGEGPTLVEAFTYRMGAHTTSDDPTKYRTDEERASWEAKDPILRLRAYLEKQGAADEAFFTALDEESETLGKRVREAVRAMPDPDPMAVFDHVYADGNPLVDEERAQFAAYQASFADSAEKGK